MEGVRRLARKLSYEEDWKVTAHAVVNRAIAAYLWAHENQTQPRRE